MKKKFEKFPIFGGKRKRNFVGKRGQNLLFIDLVSSTKYMNIYVTKYLVNKLLLYLLRIVRI